MARAVLAWLEIRAKEPISHFDDSGLERDVLIATALDLPGLGPG
jgi:hypothetical protein